MLTVEDLVTRLPTNLYSMTTITPILERILPIIKDTTTVQTLLTTLTTTTYTTNFMHMFINTLSKYTISMQLHTTIEGCLYY